MSISTRRGDGGETATSGGPRVSKSDLRVEAYGTIDELNCTIGVARVLWLMARKLERDAGIDARLRDDTHPAPPRSRAW